MTRRTIALVLVWTLPSIVFLGVTAIVFAAYRIPPPERLTDTERAAVLTTASHTKLPLIASAAPATPMNRIELTGVWKRSLTRPNQSGSSPSRASA